MAEPSNFSDDARKIAELTANAIKAANDDTGKHIEELIAKTEATAAAIIAATEAMTKQLRQALEGAASSLRERLTTINREREELSGELSRQADAFIRHCAESGDRLAEQHNGLHTLTGVPKVTPATPRGGPPREDPMVAIQRETERLARASSRPRGTPDVFDDEPRPAQVRAVS